MTVVYHMITTKEHELPKIKHDFNKKNQRCIKLLIFYF